MDPTSQPPKRRNHILSALTVAIEGLNIAREAPSSTPAKAVFVSTSILLTTIKVGLPRPMFVDFWLTVSQDSKANRTDYAELGIVCAHVCAALDRGMNGRQADPQLSPSILEAIEQLT